MESKRIIDNYKAKLNSLSKNLTIELNNKSEVYSPRLVINEDWKTIEEKTKVIICGDNPGIQEEKKNRYLIGTAGKILLDFLNFVKKNYGVEDNEMIFFNKTPYHSSKSSCLNSLMNNDDKESIKKSIELTIVTLFNLWKLDKSIKFYFFGVDKSTFINECFFEIIKKDELKDFYEDLFFLDHPSHDSLSKSIGRFLMKKFKQQTDLQLNFDDFIKDLSDSNKERIKPTKQ